MLFVEREGAIDPAELLEHVEWLRRLALALVRDPADAGDLAQETAIVALDSPPSEPGPLRPWLAGVARNLARMGARTGGRREARELAASLEPTPAVPSPEALVERMQTQQVVARLVLELDEPFRQTLLLRYYEGLTAAEIARRLSLPAGTVRWRLSEANARLRTALDAHHGDRRRWVALLAPLAGAAVPKAIPATVLGALAMKTKLLVAAAILVVLALVVTRQAGVWGKPSAKPADAPTTAATTPPSTPTPARALTPTGAVASDEGGPVLYDDEPRGTLRLEGQVLDEKEQPVPNATIAIDAHPPRVVTAGDDGSFALDGLIGRPYRLEAHAGKTFGAIDVRLSSTTEPVILRMHPAGTVALDVRAAATDKPIANADVEVRSTIVWAGKTAADGTLVLDGIGETYMTQIAVRAPGFAPAALRLPTTGDPKVPQRQTVRLVAGAPVTGHVVDPAGKPIAGARVLAVDVTQPFPVVDARRDAVVTDAKGVFRFDALGAGTVRFTADHAAHAPGASVPYVLDGTRPREVVVKLLPGASLSGKVKDPAGKPVAGAEVRVVARGGLEWRYARQAVTDASGGFALGGLPRRALEVVAIGDGTASAITPAPLDQKSKLDLTLTLDVAGAIAGVVVDDAGKEIPEAQVMVEPVWHGAAGEREAWQVRRIPAVIADGGGAFRVGALPAGDYAVRAARPGSAPDSLWLRAGTPAKTGDAALRVILPPDGRVTGKVLFADGTAPPLFTVSVGPARPVPVSAKDGSFSVDAPGGVFNLSIEGPALEPTTVAAVEVAGGAKDVGTITVKKGRSVSGRVLGPDGAPVAGAQVAAGGILTGGGTELYIEDESPGAKATMTDADGRFVLNGYGHASMALVAGKPEVGRSRSVRLPSGDDSVVIDLVLEATGGLDGKLTKGGAPLAETVIIVNPMAASGSNFFVVTGEDGSFALDTLAGGDYIVSGMIGGGGPKPKDMHMKRVTVTPGARAKVAIEVTGGPGSLAVAPVTEDGKPVGMAQIIVAAGTFGGETALALRQGEDLDRLLPPGAQNTLYLRSAVGAPAQIDGMKPGAYTACAVVMPGTPNLFSRPKVDDPDALPMKCLPVTVGAAGQTLTITVPTAWTVETK